MSQFISFSSVRRLTSLRSLLLVFFGWRWMLCSYPLNIPFTCLTYKSLFEISFSSAEKWLHFLFHFFSLCVFNNAFVLHHSSTLFTFARQGLWLMAPYASTKHKSGTCLTTKKMVPVQFFVWHWKKIKVAEVVLILGDCTSSWCMNQLLQQLIVVLQQNLVFYQNPSTLKTLWFKT